MISQAAPRRLRGTASGFQRLARRTNVAHSGTAFGLPDPAVEQPLEYNDRNELAGSSRDELAWSYNYDPIGNRVTYDVDDDGTMTATTYLTNALNQYYRADANGAQKLRQGSRYDEDGNLVEYFVAADMNCDGVQNLADINPFSLALSDAAQYEAQYPNCDILNGDINGDGTTNMGDVNPFIALLEGGGGGTGLRAEYEWDGENRLVGRTTTTPQNGELRYRYAYDYLGRRVAKLVEYWDGLGWAPHPSLGSRYVWHGWLLLMELEGSVGVPPADKVIRKYMWGLDLAGLNGNQSPEREGAGLNAGYPPRRAGRYRRLAAASSAPALQAAGGIGGLLAVQDANGTPANPADDLNYVYFYDGNGNVGQVLDVSGPPLKAKYEYDPYGKNQLDPADPNESGPYAAANPFRWSTKYRDAETGLGYWGYRYYDPRLGRWLNRDPIEEDGGANLYGYVQNRPADRTDPLGLASVEAGDRTKACCWYQTTTVYTEDTPMGGWRTRTATHTCATTRSCAGGASTPEGCCGCCGRSRLSGGTGYSSTKLVRATWGACCFCTLAVKRGSWLVGPFDPYHTLEISCPAWRGKPAFGGSIEQGSSGYIAWHDDVFNQEPITDASKQIPCYAGHDLRARLERAFPGAFRPGAGKNWQEYSWWLGKQCRSFAYGWYNLVEGVQLCGM